MKKVQSLNPKPSMLYVKYLNPKSSMLYLKHLNLKHLKVETLKP